jgi:hypothetical protein
VIVTDGLENASKEFTQEQIRKLVSDLDDWRFVFIGANQDAVLTAKGLDMSEVAALTAGGVPEAFRYANVASSALRGSSDSVYAQNAINYAALQDDVRTDAT